MRGGKRQNARPRRETGLARLACARDTPRRFMRVLGGKAPEAREWPVAGTRNRR